MVLNGFIAAAVRKLIIVIVLVTSHIFIIILIAPSMKVIFRILMERQIISSDVFLWRSQWLPRICLNEANSSVFNTLQLIHFLERYCVLRVLMGVTLVEVRDVLVIMSQVVISGISVWVLPIVGWVTMPMNILEATEIVIINWMMHFFKNLVVCQFHFLLIIATIFSIKGMIKLRVHLMFENEVVHFSFVFYIFELFLWH